MTILVTGGSGFIGTHLVRYLLRETGHGVVNVDKLTYAANPSPVPAATDAARYRLVVADIADSRTLADVFAGEKPGAVIHLAAESHVDRSITGPEAFIQSNIVGTFRLLEQARTYFEGLSGPARESFRFLHVSTDEVYGSLGPEGAAFTESSPYEPHSPYSASKAAADHLARAWHTTYGLPVIVTNCSNNYGPWQFPEKLIPVTIIKALRGEPIPVYGRGENVRDWLHAADHAEALYAALECGRVGRTYNIGADNERRNIDLVQSLCALLDELAPSPQGSHGRLISFVGDRPGHDRRYAIDASRAREELGWRPRTDFLRGLRETVLWYLENRDWWEAALARMDVPGTPGAWGVTAARGRAASLPADGPGD
ncbi:dTDP-glucose 4,6-dehydratase [Ruficoccus amylovorans]|uniref:dTDP-glucose 4,6-dehydratase n=1 Tax=Ruficoccus amylovorans TaxID=1804625 RepID=A0A842HI05_9BACT|nr:dTDP-glucose 4,6-dehydratase [Ruficoccus amylovorans]MBC2595628.1 dTDP-glucose 4,6-dehydratase [Ruficoccus amylovorans]